MHRAFLALALAVPASAATFVVDANNGPGTSFTDMPPAVAAATHGDVLIVRAGNYSPFTVDERLTIVGQGQPLVTGAITVQNVAGGRVALVGLRAKALHASACTGVVVLQELDLTERLTASNLTDLRLRDVAVLPPRGPTTDAVTLDACRLEADGCEFRGSSGCGEFDGCAGGAVSGQDGGTGLVGNGANRLHLSRTNVSGGMGAAVASGPASFFGGDGGHGIYLPSTGATRLLLTGGNSATVIGASGGCNCSLSTCERDGSAGCAVVGFSGSTVVHSGTTVTSAGTWYGIHCLFLPGTPFCTTNPPTPSQVLDPTLAMSGSPFAGAFVTFELRGPPNALATWWFGRSAVLVPEPGIEIERLAQRSRTVSLGPLPASGIITFAIQIPSTSPPGAFLCTQAEVVDQGSGNVLRTNSVPIVVR
jgi:hypothetical protein